MQSFQHFHRNLHEAIQKSEFSKIEKSTDLRIGVEFEFYPAFSEEVEREAEEKKFMSTFSSDEEILNKIKTKAFRSILPDFIQNHPNVIHLGKYHSGKNKVNQFRFELDPSLSKSGVTKQNGVELITPIMTVQQTLSWIPKILEFIDEHGSTNEKCGLHITISSKSKNIENADLLKLYWLSAEQFVYKIMPERQFNVYSQPIFKKLRRKLREQPIEKIIEFLQNKPTGFKFIDDDINSKQNAFLTGVIVGGSRNSAINFQNQNRVEFRSIGGKNYQRKTIRNQLMYMIKSSIFAFEKSFDREYKLREYARWLFGQLNETEFESKENQKLKEYKEKIRNRKTKTALNALDIKARKLFGEAVEEEQNLAEAKRNQIRSMFDNNDFRVGLEFEFYNEDFLRDAGRLTAEEVLVIGQYADLINETKAQNRRLLAANKMEKKKTTLVSAEDILNDFEQKDLRVLLNFFSQNGIDRKELEELTYRYINSALEKLEKWFAPGDYRKDIFQKYTGEHPKLKKYLQIIIKTVSTQTDEISNEVKRYYKKPEKLPKFIKDPKILTKRGDSDPTRWTITTDESILATIGGIEFVSPPLPPKEAIEQTEKIFYYIAKNGNTKSHSTDDTIDNRKNAQCGLHINISFTPERMKNFDALKFILFSNEGQVKSDKLFGDRKHADYIGEILKEIRQIYKRNVRALSNGREREFIEDLVQNKMSKGKKFLNSMIYMVNDKYSNINMKHYSQRNKTKRRRSSERIEIRYFGGENYERKFPLFKKVLGELLYALDVATDPEKEKNNYYRKVYRLLSSIEQSPKLKLNEPPF
jgi:hypothetical protein